MDQVYVVRHKVKVEGLSAREVARQFGISRNTVRRYVEGTAVPGRRPDSGKLRARRFGGNGAGLRPPSKLGALVVQNARSHQEEAP
jgi:hypothetical protein